MIEKLDIDVGCVKILMLFLGTSPFQILKKENIYRTFEWAYCTYADTVIMSSRWGVIKH